MTESDLIVGMKRIMDILQAEDHRTVRKLRKEGLPITKVGGRWMSTRTLIKEWIEKRAISENGHERKPAAQEA